MTTENTKTIHYVVINNRMAVALARLASANPDGILLIEAPLRDAAEPFPLRIFVDTSIDADPSFLGTISP